MRRKVSYCVYLDPEQKDALLELSRKTKVPQAIYLRETLNRILKEHGIRIGSKPTR